MHESPDGKPRLAGDDCAFSLPARLLFTLAFHMRWPCQAWFASAALSLGCSTPHASSHTSRLINMKPGKETVFCLGEAGGICRTANPESEEGGACCCCDRKPRFQRASRRWAGSASPPHPASRHAANHTQAEYIIWMFFLNNR